MSEPTPRRVGAFVPARNGTSTGATPTGPVPDPVAASIAATHARRLAVAVDLWRKRVPARYRAATWESLCDADPPHDTAVLANLDGFCREPKDFLMFLGPVGTGKTHAACAVTDRLVRERGWTAKFLLATELFDELRFDSADRQASKRESIDVQILVIDDLFAASRGLTEWEEKQIDAILSRRWMDERSTIITTNLAPGSVRTVLGDRLHDRLRDGLAVVIKGDSRRGRG